MILPQSSAFVSLRARLSVVNSSGYAPPPLKPTYAATRKTAKDEIKWQELLSRELLWESLVTTLCHCSHQTSGPCRRAMNAHAGKCKASISRQTKSRCRGVSWDQATSVPKER